MTQLKKRITIWGKLFYFICKKNNERGYQNILKIYGNSLSKKELKLFMQHYYSNFANFVKDFFLIIILKDKFFSNKKFNFMGKDNLLHPKDSKQGTILLTGHFHNWEYLNGLKKNFQTQEPLYEKYLPDLYCVRKKIRLNWCEKRLRQTSIIINEGDRILLRESAIRKAFSILKKKHTLLFLFDINPKNYTEHKIPTTFIGYETSSYKTLAWLVQKTNARVVPMFYYKSASKSIDIEFLPELEWISHPNFEEEIKLNTTLYNKTIENMIHRYPENWLWSQKRW